MNYHKVFGRIYNVCSEWTIKQIAIIMSNTHNQISQVMTQLIHIAVWSGNNILLEYKKQKCLKINTMNILLITETYRNFY